MSYGQTDAADIFAPVSWRASKPICSGDDLLRVTWNDQDPKKGIYYQYIVSRVAFKDSFPIKMLQTLEQRVSETFGDNLQKILQKFDRATASCLKFHPDHVGKTMP